MGSKLFETIFWSLIAAGFLALFSFDEFVIESAKDVGIHISNGMYYVLAVIIGIICFMINEIRSKNVKDDEEDEKLQ